MGSPALARSQRAKASASCASVTSAAGKADALVEAHEMGRRIDVDAHPGGFQHRAHERDGGALAVGARHMDRRRQAPVRIAERCEQALGAAQRQVDLLGMQREETRHEGVGSVPVRVHRALRRLPWEPPPQEGFRDRGRLARAGEQRAQAREGGAHVVARHHHVDHAVGAQVFGALEAFGQLFADGLLDHARAGEADHGAGSAM